MMEKDIQVGQMGDLEFKIEKGVGTATLKLAPCAGVKLALVIEVDAEADLELLKAFLKGKYPQASLIIDFAISSLEKALEAV